MKTELEEAAESFAKTQVVRGQNLPEWDDKVEEIIARIFTEGAKYMAERSYSEEDIKEAFFSGCQSERQIKPRIKCWEQWFEQFKKK